jgi:hypothetical protein
LAASKACYCITALEVSLDVWAAFSNKVVGVTSGAPTTVVVGLEPFKVSVLVVIVSYKSLSGNETWYNFCASGSVGAGEFCYNFNHSK